MSLPKELRESYLNDLVNDGIIETWSWAPDDALFHTPITKPVLSADQRAAMEADIRDQISSQESVVEPYANIRVEGGADIELVPSKQIAELIARGLVEIVNPEGGCRYELISSQREHAEAYLRGSYWIAGARYVPSRYYHATLKDKTGHPKKVSKSRATPFARADFDKLSSSEWAWKEQKPKK